MCKVESDQSGIGMLVVAQVKCPEVAGRGAGVTSKLEVRKWWVMNVKM